MQFANRVVKGQTGPNPLRPRTATLGMPDDAAEPFELALARDLAGVELRALNRGSIFSHNQPDKLRLHHAQRDNQNRGKFMLTSTTISRPLARGIEPKTRAFLRRLEGTPDLDQQTVEEARHGNRVVHIKVLSLGMPKWEIPIYGNSNRTDPDSRPNCARKRKGIRSTNHMQ